VAIKVLAFGELLWDIIEGNHCIGGAPLNFAGHMAKLGADCSLVSAVGSDALGEKALQYLDKQGINSSFIESNNSPTGTVQVELKKGIPVYNIVQGAAWDSIELDSEFQERLKEEKWDVLYFGSLAQRSEKSRVSARWIMENVKRTHLFFDVNLREQWFNRQIVEDTVKAATILKLNDEEVPVVARLLFGKALSEEQLARNIIEAYSVHIVIVTLGGEGALFFDKQREYKLCPEFTKVVDTVGAGDSFSGAFLYSYLNTGDIDRAGRLALDVASFVVSSEGALPDYSENLREKIALHLK